MGFSRINRKFKFESSTPNIIPFAHEPINYDNLIGWLIIAVTITVALSEILILKYTTLPELISREQAFNCLTCPVGLKGEQGDSSSWVDKKPHR